MASVTSYTAITEARKREAYEQMQQRGLYGGPAQTGHKLL